MVRSINAKDIAGKAVKTGKSLGLSLIKDTLVGIGLLVLLSGTGAVCGKNYYQKYNDKTNELQDIISTATYKFTQAREQELIGKKQENDLKSTLQTNEVHYGRDAFNSALKLDYIGFWNNLKQEYEAIINPDKIEQIKEKAKADGSGLDQMVSENNQKKSAVETALDGMVSTSCSEDSLQEYLNALNTVKNLELPTQVYEEKFGKIEIKCAETNYFNDLSTRVLRLIETMKSKKFDSNAIVNEVGYLFGDEVTKVEDIYKNALNLTTGEKQEMQNYLASRTEELSEIVSKELGDTVELKGYL